MSRITDYRFLFQDMFGTAKTTMTGTFQLSQLNSRSVQAQLKAAGIDTNSKSVENTLAKSNHAFAGKSVDYSI